MTTRKLSLLAVILLLLPTSAWAQSASASLANLPDADVLIYASPQRILSEAAPKFMPAKELGEMRAQFTDMKKSAGIDPATVEYVVIAARFNKPAADLSFVPPDVMAVFGGDFSSDSLFTLAQLYLQDKVRVEKYGGKTIALTKVDPIAAQAEKMPMLKSLSEIGAVPLTANSIAIGTLSYLKSAIDAANGNGRINPETLQSLLRDPNALIAATGSPLGSFAKAFGMLGTATNPRVGTCDTRFGNFYAAITMTGNNFSLRGAMHADNPDTAKIISGLFVGLMQQGIGAMPDKDAQKILQSVKLLPRESEIVLEAEIPEQAVTDLFKPKREVVKPATIKSPVRRPVKKRAR